MSVVSNLFDVAMVFAVALMVALVSRYNMTEMLSQEDFTMVKNPGKENMEIITKEGEKINRYTPSEDQDSKSGKRGKKVGIYLALVPALVAGRIVAAVVKFAMLGLGYLQSFTLSQFVQSYLIIQWPAILLQLTLIPIVVFALQKAKLVE